MSLKSIYLPIICDGLESGNATSEYPLVGYIKRIVFYGGSNNYAPEDGYNFQLTAQSNFVGSPVYTGNGSLVLISDTITSGTLPTVYDYMGLATQSNGATFNYQSGNPFVEGVIIDGLVKVDIWNMGSVVGGKRVGLAIYYDSK